MVLQDVINVNFRLLKAPFKSKRKQLILSQKYPTLRGVYYDRLELAILNYGVRHLRNKSNIIAMAADFLEVKIVIFYRNKKHISHGSSRDAHMNLYFLDYNDKFFYLVPTNLQVIGITELKAADQEMAKRKERELESPRTFPTIAFSIPGIFLKGFGPVHFMDAKLKFSI